MKRIAIALLATVGLAAAHSARADTSLRIGVNIGAPVYRHAPAPVVVAPPPAVVYAPAPVVVAPSRGYWKDVHVKTWVPERWVVRHNRWGRPERHCEPGYYTYTTQRVWVDGHHHRSHGHDNHHYGHDNRRDHSYGWRR